MLDHKASKLNKCQVTSGCLLSEILYAWHNQLRWWERHLSTLALKKQNLFIVTWPWNSLSFAVTQYHLLPIVFICCYSLSLVAIRCHLLYHSLSFVVTLCTTRMSFYKRSDILSVFHLLMHWTIFINTF